jgi:hypothetical protein
MTTSEAYRAHIEELERRAHFGDGFAAQSLSAIALVASGWCYGDPDPTDGPDGDGGKVIDLKHWLERAAA